jgi:hypothetical protein
MRNTLPSIFNILEWEMLKTIAETMSAKNKTDPQILLQGQYKRSAPILRSD